MSSPRLSGSPRSNGLYPGSASNRPILNHRGRSTPPRQQHIRLPDPSQPATPDLEPSSAFYNAGASALDLTATGGGIHRHRPRRGMTFEEVQEGHIISSKEGSALFDGIPITEDEIKKLPKKVRPYYEHLALLHEHYLEADALLAGELPSTIAKSFQPGAHKSYTRLLGDLADEVAEEDPGASVWFRRGSAWRVNGNGSGAGGEQGTIRLDGDTEVGEDTHLLQAEKKEAKRDRIAKLALNVNTIVNVLLVGAKAVAVLYSSSISLTASLVDSALDMLSTFIILGTSWAIGAKSDAHLYPAGKRRFEPLGVLIFSVAMIASFIQVFIESFERAIAPAEEAPVDLSVVGMSTMLATIGIKAVLWIWCSRIPSSGVQALAQDAENDVYLNVMSLAFPFMGTKLGWRLLDPIGGMVLSAYIIIEWVKTLLQNFANLSGKAASKDQLTRVLYLVSRFNPVLEIGDVECYHIGDDLIVEIDVILPRSSTLHFAHDVGETIQCVLESLDGVLRAYVHCDYSSRNPAQHTARTPFSTEHPSAPWTKSSDEAPIGGEAAQAEERAAEARIGKDGEFEEEGGNWEREIAESPAAA
ncbi:hypothetical protein JCM24511_08269 [Saitozyma sp. JCM 24511]|nr:hypothetical protein JCM24511_08269 [Saitozyma sp. JCM 24511]